MKVWLQPKQWERRYQRYLKATAASVKAEFLARLGHIIKLQKQKAIVEEDDESYFDTPTVEKNSDEITYLIAALYAWWNLQKVDVRVTLRGYYNAVNIYNDTQFRGVVKSLTGLSIPTTRNAPYKSDLLVSPYNDIASKLGEDVDIFRTEPYLDGIEKNWVAMQETYIDRTVNDAVSSSELAVRKGLVTSAGEDIILGVIGTKFNTVGQYVNQFADNQINSLDVQLSENRQRSLGANEYVWETRRDERVRGNPIGVYANAKPSHYDRQGQVFSWNNPPVDGHPGEAPNCRCRAIMRLPR